MMSAMMIIAKLLHKPPDTVNAISISVLIMLIYNPFIIFDTGLILSYGGTIGILIFANMIGIIKNYFLKIVAVSSSAQAILMPIIAYMYGSIHPLFIISSLFGTPLFSFIILIGFAFVVIIKPICLILKYPLEIAILLFSKVAQIISTIPFSKINIAKPTLVEVFLYFLIILIVLEKRIKIHKKKLITICLIALLILQISKILPSNFKIYFIDVGQGDCTLIQTENHNTIMIDSGGTENLEEYDVGKNVLVPYLLSRGITKLDYIMISHFHADHCNRFYYNNE